MRPPSSRSAGLVESNLKMMIEELLMCSIMVAEIALGRSECPICESWSDLAIADYFLQPRNGDYETRRRTPLLEVSPFTKIQLLKTQPWC
jgi:hypothetical protein